MKDVKFWHFFNFEYQKIVYLNLKYKWWITKFYLLYCVHSCSILKSGSTQIIQKAFFKTNGKTKVLRIWKVNTYQLAIYKFYVEHFAVGNHCIAHVTVNKRTVGKISTRNIGKNTIRKFILFKTLQRKILNCEIDITDWLDVSFIKH